MNSTSPRARGRTDKGRLCRRLLCSAPVSRGAPASGMSPLRPEEHEHLALERLEIAEALRDDLEHDPVVDAPVLVDQKIAQSLHAPERVGHRLGYRLAAGELFEQIVFLTRESQAHPGDEQCADV